MPERGFNTELWNDSFVRKLPKDAKFLFIYLWTNPHCNQAGLYEIDPETIAFETKLAAEDIPTLLDSLKPKVVWYPDSNLVWVKNFIKRQAKSPKFLIAAAKCLAFISNNGAVQELIEYNYSIHSISIPYPYSSSSNPIPSSASASADLYSSSKAVKRSLFSSSLFSLDEVNAVLSSLPRGVDRLVDHELIKQTLSEIGVTKGYRVQSEYPSSKGRIDLCWFNERDEIIAAFEIDYRTPRDKSLEKLKTLGCLNAYIVLRTDKARAECIPMHERIGEEGFDTMRRLYEENIGLTTPVVADKLNDLLRTYPVSWFEEALKEAVGSEHRNLKYIEAILERWKAEGFQAPKASNRQGKKDEDPDKYTKGKYGHLVQR